MIFFKLPDLLSMYIHILIMMFYWETVKLKTALRHEIKIIKDNSHLISDRYTFLACIKLINIVIPKYLG